MSFNVVIMPKKRTPKLMPLGDLVREIVELSLEEAKASSSSDSGGLRGEAIRQHDYRTGRLNELYQDLNRIGEEMYSRNALIKEDKQRLPKEVREGLVRVSLGPGSGRSFDSYVAP